jgi:outer membrane protein assembly factor BamA
VSKPHRKITTPQKRHRKLGTLRGQQRSPKSVIIAGATFGMLSLMCACSPVRHVPDGEYLLDKVAVSVNDSSGSKSTFTQEELLNYLRQLPNHKLLWKVKMQLGVYNMSGKDSTKWYNKLARRLGEAPVIFDEELTAQSQRQLQRAFVNQGFLHADVVADTFLNAKKRKASVNYRVTPGERYMVQSVNYNIPNDTLNSLILADSIYFPVQIGDPLDRNQLESQRALISEKLRNKGYFGFSKEFISFVADTTENSSSVDLTMNVAVPQDIVQKGFNADKPWFVRKVTFVMDYDAATMFDSSKYQSKDTVYYRDIEILYGDSHYLRPSVLYENCFVHPGGEWSAKEVDRTYESLSRLGILKFVNVKSQPVAEVDGKEWIDVVVLLTPGKNQSLALELEGTNSEGDLGVAAAVTYSHRNVGKGSETLTTKFRGAYESLSGDLDGFVNNRYMEYSLDVNLNFPKFKFPFLSDEFKRKIKAATEFKASLNYQERPEYTRVIANTGWSYRWTETDNSTRHVFTPFDVDYIYLPKSTNNFIDEIAPDNPLLRYSYEDHFIMRLGYSFYHTNKPSTTLSSRYFQQDIYTVRVKAETAGNLLFAVNSIFNHRSNFHNDPYKIFGINYAQYFKVEGDYSLLHIFDTRNAVAFHAGVGVAMPYANSSIIPFEKRFYQGGANGVRGWDVRTLGPGSFDGANSVSSFINQCGDIRLDLNVEYRAKLFWIIELGAFVDLGNIWTIHNYENQPGGMFHFNSFYKEIAGAYGIGVRMDFNYFLLRLDMGMKAHNPAAGQEPWPLVHPNWHRDSSFHFSIGYPF